MGDAESTFKSDKRQNCVDMSADLAETVIQVVDCDPAEGALLLAAEYSRSLIGKGGFLQRFPHGLEDLV